MVIELADDVALVLFDALTRAKSEDDQRSLVLEHPAERNALWMLEAQLEKGLAPFRADYPNMLAAARARLETAGGSWWAHRPSGRLCVWNASPRFSRALMLLTKPTISSTPI